MFYADATAGLGMGEAYSDSKVVIKGAVGSKMLFQSNSSFQNGGVIYSNTANGFKSLVNLSVGNTGSISFLDNYTRYEGNGGSIYSNGSASEVNLSGGSNAEITFSGNISRYSGGAIYSQSSGEWETSLVKLSVGDNGLIKFDGNKNNSDYMYAGAIYSDSAYISQIDIGAGAGGRILFNKNLAGSGGGGAIYSNAMTGTAPGIRSIVNLSTGDGGKIKFTDNNSKGDGGAIFAYGINGSSINIAGGKNSEVAFTGNRAADNKYKRGGAVANTASTDPVSLLITAGEGSAVDISNNEASRAGGGIYSFSISNSSVRVNSGDDTRVYFIGNISGEDGGAIYSESTEQNYNDRISEVVVSAGDKSDILFVDNKANANHGGGISSVSAKQSGVSVQTGDGGSVSFTYNEAKKYGGAVYSSGGTTSLVHMEAGKNGLISVSDNSGASGGGAVYLSAQNEGRVVKFERNKAASGFGGAISAYSNSSGDTVLFKVGAEGRGQLLINGNEAGSDGGAVYVSSRIATARFDGSNAHQFQFDSNKSGGSGGFLSINGQNQAFLYMTSGDSADKSITFSSNYATKDGGAISFAATNDASNLVMQGSGKYFFTGNMAGGDGGAISATSKNGVVNLGFGGSGSFAAPAEFRNNISGGLGGAIYVKSKGADVNFTGGVLFRSNKSGAIIAGQGASHSGGTANAMYVDYADSSDTAYFVLDSGSYFYDPITSSNLGRAQININQNAGANGTVLFSGVDYAAGSDDVKSIGIHYRTQGRF